MQVDYLTLERAVIASNVYSLFSLGLSLTYITTRIPSFAHGDLATVGAYTCYLTILLFLRPLGLPASVYVTFPLAALAAGLVAFAVYNAVFRPLVRRGASVTTLMIASFGAHFLIYAVLAILTDCVQSRHGIIIRNAQLFQWEYVWPGTDAMMSTAINSTLALAAIAVLLYLLLYKTRYGVIMRASVDNMQLAKVMGIDIERVFMVTWLLIGAVTGIAGIYAAMIFPLTEELGWFQLPVVFAASIVGGLSRVYGAMLGGYLTGASMVLGGAYLLAPLHVPLEFQLVIPFAMVVIVLLLAPQGLVEVIERALARRG
ncbi:MAG: branched-chain amino acid ABC transporter permease [Thermoproteaceae archaeon]|nr:branched-chain amino acid ABC transporter permease [Thermoproteaceae archaeon]